MNGYDILVLKGTTAADGSATVDSAIPVTGEVVYVEVDGAALTNGADLTLKPIGYKLADGAEELGEAIINHGDVGNTATDTLYPRRFAQDNAGADLTVATSTKVAIPYFVPGLKLRATIANGGNAVAYRIRVFVRR